MGGWPVKTSRTHSSQTLTGHESFKAGAVEPKGPSRALRFLRRALVTVAVVMGLAYFVGPRLAAPFVRQQLQQMVSKNLNATLTMDGLSYQFPYGVRARNAALVTTDEQGRPVDLLRVKELELALAELPLGKGPLVIERIIVREPSAHLIVNEHGLVGGRGLVKRDAEAADKKEKPSDYFRLRKFEMRDGAIVFEDRRGGGGPPVVWKNLAVDLNIEPGKGSLYAFEVMAKNAPLATANVRGRVDVDAAVLDVEKFILALRVEQGKPQEQLPPMLQDALRRYEVAGGLSVSGRARVPLREPDSSEYEAALDLPSASARVSEGAGRIDRVTLKLRVVSEDQEVATTEVERPVTLSALPPAGTQASSRPAAYTRPGRQPPMIVKLDLLEVGTSDTLLHVEKGEAVIDPATQQWRVKELLCRLDVGRDRSGLPSRIGQALGKLELTGKVRLTATAVGPLRPAPTKRVMDQVEYQLIAHPRDIAVKPPKWTAPFTNVSGTVRANREALIFENVEAEYFEDRFFVAGARIPLDDVTRELRINEITGSATLTGKVESYPKPFDFAAKQLHPSGTWHAIGYFARKRGLKPG